MKDNQHEQLFSELTPAEAAVVEGGFRVVIDRIQAIRAGADPVGADDTYITVNGRKIWGHYNMTRGRTRSVNSHYQSPFATEAVRVQLVDYDWAGGHDNLGGFFAVRTNGVVKKQVQGSGSIYEVYYSAW